MSDKKKLVYVVTKSSWGGAQRYVYDLAQSFKDEYDVEIWCGKDEIGTGLSLGDKAATARICIRNIEGLGRDINLNGDFRAWHCLYNMIRIQKPDILHLNSTKVGAFGGVIGRIFKVRKIVYTAHGLASFEDRRRWQKFLISIFDRAIFALVDRVILISTIELRFTKKWLKSEKHSLIFNGIRPIQGRSLNGILKQLPKNIKAKFDMNNTVKFVGIGELHKNKGLEFALAAFHKLVAFGHDFTYVHFGEGELRAELMREVRRLGLENHVFFYGFKEDASAYLPHFDALVLSSVKEGLPYVLLEAGLAGIPAFASRVGGIPEIISDGSTGRTHNAKDVAALTNHLSEFIMVGNYNKDQIRDKITATFSFSQMVKKTSAVYNS